MSRSSSNRSAYTLYVKAFGDALTINDSNNIHLGSRGAPLVVPQNAVATFVRFDLAGEWLLTALSTQ
ncbi:hypothetical protein [Curtobacterium poinsettiae]|uniref:hypothetical protein n=1 Tax=Curtobacterium poinsettiae TaxID=159612 RepID=UPI0021C7F960|nr:hypothetical protein [Curtobacterium flaccumfaciens]MCU0153130.1 hypothetical protein [Curtobacterium flaccumfaciens pv. poinsettiae]UXN14915.1 hypothetical protein N8D76_16175 [Curtobacterium flaccumfaciens pv. poinsettiae]